MQPSTLWERIELVCKLRGYSNAGAWSEDAGLTRTHIYRLKNDANVKRDTLDRLAEVAGIKPAWLTYGVGEMLKEHRSSYPNREEAVAAAEKLLGGIDPETISAIMSLAPDHDPPIPWWFAQIEAARAMRPTRDSSRP